MEEGNGISNSCRAFQRFQLKHCQRHNGPEGWVHITILTQISIKSNFKISIKSNFNQTSVSGPHQSSLLNGSQWVSQWVSEWDSDKHSQWSDSGPMKITYCSKDEMEQRKRLNCLLIFGPIVQKQTDFSKVRSHNLGICERSTPLDSSLQHIMIMSVVGLISFSRISWAALFKSSWTISVAFQWNRSVSHHDFVLEAPQ